MEGRGYCVCKLYRCFKLIANHIKSVGSGGSVPTIYFDASTSPSFSLGTDVSVGLTPSTVQSGFQGGVPYVACLTDSGQATVQPAYVALRWVRNNSEFPVNVGDVFRLSGSMDWWQPSQYAYNRPVYQGISVQGLTSEYSGGSYPIGTQYIGLERSFLFNRADIYSSLGSFNQTFTITSGNSGGLLIQVLFGTYSSLDAPLDFGSSENPTGGVGSILSSNTKLEVVSRA